MRRLTDTKKDRIVKLRAEGCTVDSIAKTVGCSAASVHRICQVHKPDTTTPTQSLADGSQLTRIIQSNLTAQDKLSIVELMINKHG